MRNIELAHSVNEQIIWTCLPKKNCFKIVFDSIIYLAVDLIRDVAVMDVIKHYCIDAKREKLSTKFYQLIYMVAIGCCLNVRVFDRQHIPCGIFLFSLKPHYRNFKHGKHWRTNIHSAKNIVSKYSYLKLQTNTLIFGGSSNSDNKRTNQRRGDEKVGRAFLSVVVRRVQMCRYTNCVNANRSNSICRKLFIKY